MDEQQFNKQSSKLDLDDPLPNNDEVEVITISSSYFQNQRTITSLSDLYGVHHHHNIDDNVDDDKNKLLLLPRKKSLSSVHSLFTSRSIADDEPDSGDFHSEGHSVNNLNTFNFNFNYKLQALKSKKRKAKYDKPMTCCFRIQNYVYKFLNQPSNPLAILYHFLVSICLLIYTGHFLLIKRGEWHSMCHYRLILEHHLNRPHFLFETILVLSNLIEFLLRLWSSRSLVIYSNISIVSWLLAYLSRLSHIFDVIMIVASLVLVPCFISIPQDIINVVFMFIVLRAFHRLFNILQWTSVQLRESPWKLMGEVFREQGNILLGMIYLQICIICFMAYSVFVVENFIVARNETIGGQDVQITNLVDALYWSSVTLATIGFGDMVPLSYGSKLITFICLMISMALFSLPSGIIATSLALKIDAKEEIQKRKEQKHLAASLIQNLWRLYRREKRFRLAELLWNRIHEAKGGNSLAANKKVKVAKRFKRRLNQIMTRRSEYYVYRFIQLIRIQMLGKQFFKHSNHNIRASIQSHWIEHQSLTTMLDSIRLELDKKCQVVKEQEMVEVEITNKLDEIQLRLSHLNQMASDQEKIFKDQINLNY